MKSVMRTALVGSLAMLALSAVATASASAYTNPILVNSKGKDVSKLKFTGVSEARPFPVVISRANISGAAECKKETTTGEVSTTGTGTAATTSGTATAIFTDCHLASLGKCTSSGKAAGEIESKVSLSLVWLDKESEEKPGVRESIVPMSAKPGNGEGAKLDFTCFGVSFDTEGAFIASLSRQLNEEFTETVLTAKQAHAKQEYTKYTEEGKEGENNLFSSWGGAEFEEAAAQLEEEQQTYGEKVKTAKS
jgi:hypothetical protein